MVLVWVAAGLALLYLWLIGHWFARVVAAGIFAVFLGTVGYGVGDKLDPESVPTIIPAPPPTQEQIKRVTPRDDVDRFLLGMGANESPRHYLERDAKPTIIPGPPKSHFLAVLACLIGVVAAWFVAGIPVYRQRHIANRLARRIDSHINPDIAELERRYGPKKAPGV